MCLGDLEEKTITQLESERSGYRKPAYGGAGSWATHHLKVSAHEAVEILLVPTIELRKQTTPSLKMQSQPDQGSDLNGREKRAGMGNATDSWVPKHSCHGHPTMKHRGPGGPDPPSSHTAAALGRLLSFLISTASFIKWS